MNGEAERARLVQADSGTQRWRRWGPYLADRAWGTVREDYSPDGTAWDWFPHDHARSRVYRWNEDGLAGICDDQQILCLALAVWNGRDPILKERIFGLGGPEGNHGEDAKEYWWHLDSTPTHSWMRWRYVYPQNAFPYDALVAVNRGRGRTDPEYELLDTGVLDAGYWDVVAEFAKAACEDMCIRITVRNGGPLPDTLHLLPTLWFRNRWAFDPGLAPPVIRTEAARMVATDDTLGTRVLLTAPAPAAALACDNESNAQRLWGVAGPAYPKDGIGDHLVHGVASVRPDGTGTKAAFHHVLTLQPGETAEVRLRLAETDADLAGHFDDVMRQRQQEADDFHASLLPATLRASDDEKLVLRQAHAGMLWGKQFYHYDVPRWLDGDPGQPPPPPQRLTGRNSRWRHLNNRDVLSMPDAWEYPWYAAWDLAFHTVVLARLDPRFAKDQLITLCREWYMHPNGQLPAYEWALGDVNPPVHAWAALRVFEVAGGDDYDFLERIFHKLLINFTWWVNRKDPEGSNVFEGGFLGLDNVGPFDRSNLPAGGGRLDQADATAWMTMYCLNMLELALVLAMHDPTYEDVATKFFEHFVRIAEAMNQRGLWDEQDGFYYDVLHEADGSTVPVRARSIVGLIPLCATTTLGDDTMRRLPGFAKRLRWFFGYESAAADAVSVSRDGGARESRLLAIVDADRLRRLLARMLDENEFLSPHGLRALSRFHRDNPLQLQIGGQTLRLDYEPGESSSGLFGGNSNWRGPVWFPVNFLLVEALRRYHAFLGDAFTVEHPTGSGRQCTLAQVADDLTDRLVGIFRRDAGGRRPVFGGYERFQQDPAFRDCLLFHEYFHGDTGMGLGASHQTGWTGLVAELLLRRGLAADGTPLTPPTH